MSLFLPGNRGSNANHGSDFRGRRHMGYPVLTLVRVVYTNNPPFRSKNPLPLTHHRIVHQDSHPFPLTASSYINNTLSTPL